MTAHAVRVAALADLHCTKTSQGALQPLFAQISESAEVLLIAGDLTDYGLPDEARVLAKELSALRIPVAAVLGNHDVESNKADEVRSILVDAGLVVLDGDACELQGIGVAGIKGFGGGFGKRALGPWGETIIKQFVREAVDEALKLEAALARLRTGVMVALLHYSPVQGTVEGEPPEIFPFLGSSRLEEPISRYPVTLVLHGHAHRGQLEGRTKSGAAVYNVSMPLLTRAMPGRPPFRIFHVEVEERAEGERPPAYSTVSPRTLPEPGRPSPQGRRAAGGRPTLSRREAVMETSTARSIHDPAAEFYIGALQKLQATNIPFLVGGAFAFSHYSHVPRVTKDIDVFVKPEDCPRVLETFQALGYRTEIPFPHWLGKIHDGEHFMDIIFNSGNGVARVDDLWFDHATKTNVLGVIVRLSPIEEMIWSKAFIQERERFDGADVLHLLRETGPSLDWPRLLMRFGDYWRVLLAHLILFGFAYPDKRQNIPAWVMEELLRRLNASRPNLQNDTCYGTLLSREQYLHDIEHWKYRDGREQPQGPMTRDQIEIWSAAIGTRDR